MSGPTQPRVHRNDWSVLTPPGLGEWEPTLSVSVVVPAYDAGRLLPYVLAGLAAQTYPAHLMEVVVVDDGPGRLELPELRPERTRVVHVAEAGTGWGRANACHTGAMASDGDVLHWYDADMLAEATQVEAQLRWHHLADYGVVLGHKWFVDPEPLLAHDPAAVRDLVAGGGLAEVFAGVEKVPHTWVEQIYDRTDRLRAAGPYAARTHTGATASLHRSLYLASGGMDTTLRLGEDSALGARLYQVGAFFLPDDDARSWHLGPTHVMTRQSSVTDYNEPFLAELSPAFSRRRQAGRSYPAPFAEVVLDVRGQDVEEVLTFVDAVLVGSLRDVRVRLLGDWSLLSDERHRVLDHELTGTRAIHESFRTEPRVVLGGEPAQEARFEVQVTTPALVPGRWALERLLLHVEHTHQGERILRHDGAPWAVVRRTAALARARRLAEPGDDVEGLAAELWGRGESEATEVGFRPVAGLERQRYPQTGGPPMTDDEAWQRVERSLRGAKR